MTTTRSTDLYDEEGTVHVALKGSGLLLLSEGSDMIALTSAQVQALLSWLKAQESGKEGE